jgi:hypothetical protein
MKKLLLILICLPIIGFGQNLAIGDNYQGGIIFYLDGNGSGLVAAPTDVEKVEWTKAVDICENLILAGFSDWYLPSQKELYAMFETVSGTLDSQNYGLDDDEFDNSNPLELIVGNEFYWTSEEKDNKLAFGFINNSVFDIDKKSLGYVRAIRAFKTID